MNRERESLVQELRETLSRLEGGLARMDRSAGLREIESWHERLSGLDEEAFGRVGSDLLALRTLIRSDARSADAIGRALAALGESTRAAGRRADDDVARHLERLGNLLFHSGHALRGPLPPKTGSPS